MSNFTGRRPVNVSQYLRDLNSIPSDANIEDTFSLENDLALFTNTQFFDIDSGQNTDFQAEPVKPDIETPHHASPVEDVNSGAASVVGGDMPNLDFMPGEFNFHELNAYPPPPSMNAFVDGSQNYQPLQPSHAPVYGNQLPQQHAAFPREASRPADKRKIEAPPAAARPGNLEEASRVAADEDKRRRNTAASARFRVKKKQREQALEKSAKEMTDKVTSLETRVAQLETENKWLKNLLVDKNEGNDDIITLWKEFAKQAGKNGKPSSSESSEPVKAEQ